MSTIHSRAPRGADYYLVYSPTWKAASRVRVRTMQHCSGTHLTSPACVLSFPLTSSSTPGVLFTLQSGTRTAACGSVGSGAIPSWFTAPARVPLIFASEARVNGAESEMMEDDGVTFAAVAVMNVLDNMLPFCLRAGRLVGTEL